jgi:hypothetical protein
MARLSHGSTVLLADVNAAREDFREMAAISGMDPAPVRLPTRFGYLFPDLQDNPTNRLVEAPATVANLIQLAATMRDDGSNNPSLNSNIPSVYTYFAQFVDHDITLEAAT